MITPIDVEDHLGRALENDEAARAVRLIPAAIGLLEAKYPGLAVNAVDEPVTVSVPVNGDTIWTPRYPVTAVDSIQVNGSDITLQWDEWGRLWANPCVQNTWELNLPLTRWTTVDLTYSFGLDPTPPVLVQAVASAVANVIRAQATNPAAAQSEMLGSYQVGYGDFSVRQIFAGLAIPDIGGLDYWDRRKRITSVGLRR